MAENIAENGVPYYTSDPIEFEEGNQFKIRQGAAWDVNYGANGANGDNIVIETAGTYVVMFEPMTGAVVLVNAETSETTEIFAGVMEWGVIGAFAGTNWDTDFPMTANETEEGLTVYTSEPIEFAEGDQFKIRLNGSWDLNYGIGGPNGENCVIETAGTYVVGFEFLTGTIVLVNAETQESIVLTPVAAEG